jgi:hypothetical protein
MQGLHLGQHLFSYMENNLDLHESRIEQRRSHKVHLVWAAVVVIISTLGVLAYKLSIDKALEAAKSVHDAAVQDLKALHDTAKKDAEEGWSEFKKLTKKASDEAEVIAKKFREGTITTTFRSESPIFELIKVGRLEVAVCESDQTFEKSDARTTAWGLFYTGTTYSKVKVPATFRYHVDMADEWRIEVKDKCCVVHAPALRPTVPVAFNTAKMETYAESGWARFDKAEILAELEKGMTPLLNSRASEQKLMNDARMQARDVVARFVRSWLLGSNQWQKDAFTSITVIFEGEATNAEAIAPTLTIEQMP